MSRRLARTRHRSNYSGNGKVTNVPGDIETLLTGAPRTKTSGERYRTNERTITQRYRRERPNERNTRCVQTRAGRLRCHHRLPRSRGLPLKLIAPSHVAAQKSGTTFNVVRNRPLITVPLDYHARCAETSHDYNDDRDATCRVHAEKKYSKTYSRDTKFISANKLYTAQSSFQVFPSRCDITEYH